ncbi:hypothetical protein Plhal710r2_c018g0076761 [Plasmopara halstedii]
MTISWSTKLKTATSIVRFGLTKNDLLTMQQSEEPCEQYKFCSYTSPWLHHVTIPGDKLKPNTLYFYQCGDEAGGWSDIYTFTAAVTVGSETPQLFGVIGDLGQTEYSQQTIRHLSGYHSNISAIICAGDLSYADSDQNRWDRWGNLMEPLIARIPWMIAAGNHEEELPCQASVSEFVAYQTRFRMPFSQMDQLQRHNMYYGFRVGLVHLIVLTPYVDSTPTSLQYKWVQKELSRVDRSVTPWLIVIMHGPWYNSNTAHQGIEPHTIMKKHMEDILYHHKVDVVVAGHVHAYERSHSVYKENVVQDGPIYIVLGDAGNREGLAPMYFDPQPKWSAFRQANYGFLLLNVANRTHAHMQWFEDRQRFVLISSNAEAATQFAIYPSQVNMTAKVSVKWGKQIFEHVLVDKSAPVAVFKEQLYALTSVPVDRQKLMSKAWKGMLKDDTDLSKLDKFVDGAGVMLMGSAEVVKKPKEPTVFIEDMTTNDIAASGTVYPAGLVNLGNTCYMNATLQCLRPVKELREALTTHPGGCLGGFGE